MEAWAKEWQEGEPDLDEEAIEWLRAAPDSIKKLMLKFPPSCLVKGTRSLMHPAPGETCIVTSYFEPDADHPEGSVTVRNHPTESTVKAQCVLSWLEVVGYYKGITPEFIKKLLEED